LSHIHSYSGFYLSIAALSLPEIIGLFCRRPIIGLQFPNQGFFPYPIGNFQTPSGPKGDLEKRSIKENFFY
jgi:hypothetical protein